jgi:hypothetical protein
VSLLAVTGASNVTGEILPIRPSLRSPTNTAHGSWWTPRSSRRTAASTLPRTTSTTSPSPATSSTHPFGAGVLVGRPDWLDAGTPHLAGGGAVKEARLDGVSWATGPARHEGGSPNVLGAATLARATQVIAGLDQEQWHAHEAAIRSFLVEGLQQDRRRHRPPDLQGHQSGTDTIGVVNFSVEGYDAGLVAAYLSAEHGVGLRDGRFCAHPLLKRLGLPSGSLRASFGVGSRLEDAERLLAGIEELRSNGLGWDYVVDAGRWVPANDTRTYPALGAQHPGHRRRRSLHRRLSTCGKFGGYPRASIRR